MTLVAIILSNKLRLARHDREVMLYTHDTIFDLFIHVTEVDSIFSIPF